MAALLLLQLRHNITGGNGVNYRLEFEVKFAGKFNGYIASIDNIMLTNSSCLLVPEDPGR